MTISELAAELRPQPAHGAAAPLLVAIVVAARRAARSRTKLDLKAIGGVITDADPALVLAALAANLVSVAAKALTWKAAHRRRPRPTSERPAAARAASRRWCRRSSSASC